MKKLFFYAALALVGWSFYQKNNVQDQIEVGAEPQAVQPADLLLVQPADNFTCDGRQYCSQMNSRAEAEYFIRNCPNTKMDGDHDGYPCENDSRF